MTQKLFRFQIAGGTIPGTDHTKPGEPFWRNNNDAYAFFQDEQITIATVTDGCGSSKHSEIGAHLIARLVNQALKKRYLELNMLSCKNHEHEPHVFRKAREDVLAQIRVLAGAMGESLSEIIGNYFLATVLGCVATEEKATFFSIGDGIFVINGESKNLGPFIDNMPPYMAYAITGSSFADEDSDLFQFKTFTIPTKDVQTVLIGSDGVEPFITHENSIVPGLHEPVGNFSQFWTDNKYFNNNDCVRRRLAQLNREIAVVDTDAKKARIQKGFLHDDATLVVLRKTNLSSP